MSEQQEQRQIDAARRVKAFLDDEAVREAFVMLEKRYFAEFKRAATPAEREQLHARVRALDDLFASVLGIVDAGKLAQHAREQRDRQAAGARTGRDRR